MSTPEPEIVRWYTVARRFPKLIGVLPGGGRIWGGPYTQTGFVVGVVLLLAANRFAWAWAHFGVLGNGLVLVAVVWGSAWGVSKLPIEARNPFSVASGLYAAATAPETGRVGGSPIKPTRPVKVRRSRVRVNQADPAPAATPPAPIPAPLPTITPAPTAVAAKPQPEHEPEATPHRPMSSVQLLLAAASKE